MILMLKLKLGSSGKWIAKAINVGDNLLFVLTTPQIKVFRF